MKNKELKILLGCLVTIVLLFSLMFSKGVIVFDHSAECWGENDIKWKGVKYVSVSGKYHEGKTIAKFKDSGFRLKETREDDSHTFVVVRSFIDQWLVVREDYEIPKSGKITKAYWNLKFIEDEEFFETVSELVEKATSGFVYDNSNNDIYQYKGDDVMRELTVAYEGCPVPTNYLGYMGTMNGRWCMTVGKRIGTMFDCYYIPDEYIPILEKYWT